MIDLLNGDNSGVVVNTRATDFTATGETGVVYQDLVHDGDWTKYKPTDEWQRRFVPPGTLGYDTNSCTDFSALNSVEAQVQRLVDVGAVDPATKTKMQNLGYFDANGRVNFNDWFNAITAGTTAAVGNTLYGPWDAIKKRGLIPQNAGFQVNDFTTQGGWFGANPTAEQYALGLQFLTMFDVKYEWVSQGQLAQWDLFTTHIRQAPLHLLVPTGSTWNNANVTNPTPTYQGVNHAISMVKQTQGVSHQILDHYNPFLKSLEWGYYIPYALKGVVTIKQPEPPEVPFKYVFTINLEYGQETEEVHQLQRALWRLGLLTKGVLGPYGPQTKAAVLAFQKGHGIVDDGTHFGPQTRAALNKALDT